MIAHEERYYAEDRLFHGHSPRIMGTRFDILVCDVPEPAAMSLWRECLAILEKYELMMDRFRPDSEVSRMNNELSAGEDVEVSPEMAEALESAMRFTGMTGGLHDVTGGKMSALHLEGLQLHADVHGVGIDFGGFAKGLAVKKMAALLDGFRQVLVDFGSSSVLAVGTHPAGDCWPVTLKSTYTGAVLTEFRLKDTALSVSGNTPGYSGHVVNPLTGRRVEGQVMTSAVCHDALEAEILSTALMAGGRENIEMLRKAFPDAEIAIY